MGDKWPGDASIIADESRKVDVICKTETVGEFKYQFGENDSTNEAGNELENEFGEFKNLIEFERGGNISTIDDETGLEDTSSMGKDESTEVGVQSGETNTMSGFLSDETCSPGELPAETLTNSTESKNLPGAQVFEGKEVRILQGEELQELEVGSKEAFIYSDEIFGQLEVDSRTETKLVDDNALLESEVGKEMEMVKSVQQSNLSCANEPEVRLMENKDVQLGEAEGGSSSSALQDQFAKPSCEEPVAPTKTTVGDSQSEMVTNIVESSGMFDEKQSLNEKLHKTCEVM